VHLLERSVGPRPILIHAHFAAQRTISGGYRQPPNLVFVERAPNMPPL
jgi:hypothetical protein